MKSFCLIVAVFLSLIFCGLGMAQDTEALKVAPGPIYRFSEHLEEAEASIVIPEQQDRVAQWDGSKLVFPKLSGLYDIQITSQSYNKQVKEGITLKPLPEALRRLRFWHVPPGSTMVLYYGFQNDTRSSPQQPAQPPQAETAASVYLNVWAGKHRLTRLSIPSTPGWNKIEISLGVIIFLLRDIVVTFDISVDERQRKPIAFDAEILP